VAARSPGSPAASSAAAVRRLAASVAHPTPHGWQLCEEGARAAIAAAAWRASWNATPPRRTGRGGRAAADAADEAGDGEGTGEGEEEDDADADVTGPNSYRHTNATE
jgi:hypothetical protein